MFLIFFVKSPSHLPVKNDGLSLILTLQFMLLSLSRKFYIITVKELFKTIGQQGHKIDLSFKESFQVYWKFH